MTNIKEIIIMNNKEEIIKLEQVEDIQIGCENIARRIVLTCTTNDGLTKGKKIRLTIPHGILEAKIINNDKTIVESMDHELTPSIHKKKSILRLDFEILSEGLYKVEELTEGNNEEPNQIRNEKTKQINAVANLEKQVKELENEKKDKPENNKCSEGTVSALFKYALETEKSHLSAITNYKEILEALITMDLSQDNLLEHKILDMIYKAKGNTVGECDKILENTIKKVRELINNNMEKHHKYFE
jgi:hypothetical protein